MFFNVDRPSKDAGVTVYGKKTVFSANFGLKLELLESCCSQLHHFLKRI